jgi:hypothetical protein
MMDASLDLQTALRARLIASGPLTSLVPATSILDRNSRPEVFPCILVGDGQTLLGPGVQRLRHEVYADLHAWAVEPGLATVKTIAGLIRDALRDGPWSLTSHHLADAYVQSTRFLRDPSGLHGHAVLTLRAHLVEIA